MEFPKWNFLSEIQQFGKKETTKIFPCSGSQGTAYSQEMFVMPLDSYNITVSYRSPGSFSLVLSGKLKKPMLSVEQIRSRWFQPI